MQLASIAGLFSLLIGENKKERTRCDLESYVKVIVLRIVRGGDEKGLRRVLNTVTDVRKICQEWFFSTLCRFYKS
jgi:hypothetical protein